LHTTLLEPLLMRNAFAFVLLLFFCTPVFAQVASSDSSATRADTLGAVGDSSKVKVDSLPSLSDSTASLIGTLRARKDTVILMGVGDIMMGTNYPDDSRLPPEGGAFLMRGVEDLLRTADITMGNLEGVLLDSGGTAKSCRDPKVCYVFRSPVTYVNNLIRAGFDILSLANNHAGDFGDEGRVSTMRTLDSAGIGYAGQLTMPYTTIVRDSITYGFVAFAPNSGCLNLNDIDDATRIIQHLDSISDIVIVSFHGGAEGAQYQHVLRQEEIFYGENRGNVYALSHAWIDAGADIVLGHGPHVTRAVDVYKGRFITYSMGNFCTYRGINIAGINGLAPIIKVYMNRTGEFLKAQIIPTYQTFDTGVQVDPDNRVIKVIQKLTEKDFQESEIQIDDNGLINYLAQ
jgi:Bacterial capsule synthesis protein PGA_cap